jgi:cobalt-zinc-cadmium efflux system outer membrane protein
MSNFPVKNTLRVLLVAGMSNVVSAQTLSLQQALDSAVQYHPASRSAALQVQQQQQLLPGVAALSDPLVTAESPTGDFYTVGVTQSFALPGVYRRQKDLQRAHIARSESAVIMTQQEVKYQTALAYNDLQYQLALTEQLRRQDSLLQYLAAAADRMFREGQTDAVASQFARLQAAALRAQLRQAEQNAVIAESQLQALTGIAGRIVPQPLQPQPIPPGVIVKDSTSWQNNPAMQMLRQDTLIAGQQIEVEKSRGLPYFTIGYLNQGERNSPVGNRFNAGVSVPLWRKRYNAHISAAQTGVEIARQNLASQSLTLDAAMRRALGEVEKARLALVEYEQNVLPAARSMADASRRLYEGGMTDLVSYLRNRKDALEAELTYWELLQAYQSALLKVGYFSGTL